MQKFYKSDIILDFPNSLKYANYKKYTLSNFIKNL